MSENLVQYGTSFQSKIITSLMLDNKFTKQIVDILEVSYFDTDSTKYLIKNIKDYFEKYKTPPTMEAIKVIIDGVDNPTLKTTIVDSLRNAWGYRESTDLEFVKEKTLEFRQIMILQGLLLNAEGDPAKGVFTKPDGDYGNKTKTAVKNFQKSLGFKEKEQDGVVGQQTAASLNPKVVGKNVPMTGQGELPDAVAKKIGMDDIPKSTKKELQMDEPKQ